MTYNIQVDYASKPGTPVLAADALKEMQSIYGALNELEARINGVGVFNTWPTVTQGAVATTPPDRALVTKEQCPFRGMVIGDMQFTTAPTLPTGLPSDIELAWLAGQTIVIANYPALFTRFGTQYNIGGEPSGTFRLPKLNGRYILVNASQGGGTTDGVTAPWAALTYGKGGVENVALTAPNNGPHTHAYVRSDYVAGGGEIQASGSGNRLIQQTTPATAVGGAGQPFSVLNPAVVVNVYTRIR